MALTAGTLHSDHVNYLVLRYLQECGHEDTARAFYRDWHRSKEFRDPEDLPFANAVQRSELVNVIQNGLRHDEVQSRITHRDRRFTWLDINPQRRELNGDADMEYATSRPSSSGKRKSLGGHAGARGFDESVKRQRLSSSGHDGVMINGHRDPMDIDVRSPSGEVEDEDAVSPAIASESAETVPTRYDSVTTQTEVLAAQKIPLPGWRNHAIVIEKPGARIFHASWNPHRNSQHDLPTEAATSNTLIVAGEAICRLYDTPSHINNELRSIEHIDEPGLPENSFITALSWHPSGSVVTCAIDSTYSTAAGTDTAMRLLLNIGRDRTGTIVHFKDLPLLQPPGIIFRVEYNRTGEYLLVVKTNGEHNSVVEVWSVSRDCGLEAKSEPLAWRILNFGITDAAWSGDRKILVCGNESQVSILTLADETKAVSSHTAESVSLHNLTEQQLVLPKIGPVALACRHDDFNDFDIFLMQTYVPDDEQSRQDQLIVIDARLYDTTDYIKSNLTFSLNRYYTTAKLQPPPTGAQARLLAVCDQEGRCEIYALSKINGAAACQPLFNHGSQTYELAHNRPILAASWSPDGKLLALAAFDLLQVWQIEYLTPNTLENRPIMTWDAGRFGFQDVPPRQNDVVDGGSGINGVNGDKSTENKTDRLRPVLLNWCNDGRKIVLAVDEKMAIIEIDRPDTSAQQGMITNGV